MLNHHAYLFEGSINQLDALADEACLRLDLKRESNADVRVQAYERFGIDESRALGQTASLRGLSAQSLFVVGVSAITTEAQQALLKLFEEPREGLTFILLAPHGVIIPTLRSRMLRWEQKSKTNDISSEAKQFLAAGAKERSEMLAKILKQDDAREQLRNLLNATESIVYRQKESPEHFEILVELAAMRPYLADRSPSLKMIFEHLVLIVPKL